MLEIYRQLSLLLSRRERFRAKLLFIIMLLSGVFEVAGVASVLPFVTVLASPSIIEHNPKFLALRSATGIVEPQQFLQFLGLVVLVLFVLALTVKAVTTYAMLRFSMMRMHSMSCRLLAAYLRQPYAAFLDRNTAAMGKRVLSEVEQATNGALLPMLRVLSSGVVAIALLLLLLVLQPIVSIVVAVVVGGAFVAVYMVTRLVLARIGSERVRTNQERFILANEALNGIKELRLLGREESYLERFRVPSEAFARYQSLSKIIGQVPQFAIQAVAFGGVIVLILYLMGRGRGVEEILPLVALYAFAGYRLLPAFQEVFKGVTELKFSAAAVNALHNDMIRKEQDVLPSSERENTLGSINGAIVLQDVSFQYPNSQCHAIRGVSLDVRPGSSVAFVGKTGSGKSTTVDLILGLLEPSDGQILVNDQPLAGVTVRNWQRNIGYVPQVSYLADDTVAANVAFGVPSERIDYEAVERAAKAAHIHDFVVNQMAKGYETVVGERGVRLSGGQRQRLAIARALYHDPAVVVFDEATSALDSATEAAVMEAIEELHGKKTMLFIAHRISTIRSCDKIFLLSEGRLAAEGSYDQLVDRSPLFRELLQMHKA